MPTVRDLQYRTEADSSANPMTFSTVSDPGTGAFPVLRQTVGGIEWQSSSTTTTFIPYSQVIRLVDTIV